MTVRRKQAVNERSTWHASELGADPRWRYDLCGEDLDELEAATARVGSMGLCAGEFGREEFPLPTLGPRIAALADEVENGRGVALLRGIPVQHYDQDSIRVLYWGFGVHAGIPISQNSKG